jgi:diguanylate cyclase (GGDEF)-like protein
VSGKKKFLQPRATVPVTAAAPADDNRAAPPSRVSGLLRLGDRIENALLQTGSRRAALIYAAFALLLLTFSGALALIELRQPEWGWLAAAVASGWAGLCLALRESRRNLHLQAEYRRLARVDSLTGVLNRAAFRQHLNSIWRQAERENTAIGLMLIDLDHFKALNDQLGHQAGDAVLLTAAQILKSYAQRPFDAVGRYGGDEFVVAWYAPEAEAFSALVKLLPAKLWMGLAASKIGESDITVSGGAVLAWPGPDLSIERAVGLADEELYKVKRSCRGTIGLIVTPAASHQQDLFGRRLSA